MKNTISLLALLLFSFTGYAQLGIGTTTPSSSALLEFGTELRGIVIGPSDAVTQTNANTAPGSICFDQATGSFRMYNGTTWSDVVSGGATGGNESGPDLLKQYMGASSSTTGGGVTNGVLILGKDVGETKALVLPKSCGGSLTIASPVAGQMYYDQSSKMVMVYNGNAWTAF